MTQTEIRDGAQAGTRFAEKSTSALERLPLSGFWFGAVGAMILSAGLFLLGRRQSSQFIGLWVPSIISLALFYKLLRPSAEVREARRFAESGDF